MKSQAIPFDIAAEIFEQMDVKETHSVGSLMIHTGKHPEHEECTLVLGDAAFLIRSAQQKN